MKASAKKQAFNLPNLLSFFRLICLPFILVFLSFGDKGSSLIAALFFALASITDVLDGFFARRYSSVTVMGKFLDPLADKLLVCMTMIMLIPLERIPVWMVIVIISREMAVTALRAVAMNEGVVIQASVLGKYKTILQTVALLGLCLHYSYFQIDFHAVGMVFLWGALILTILSGWAYFQQFIQVFFLDKQAG